MWRVNPIAREHSEATGTVPNDRASRFQCIYLHGVSRFRFWSPRASRPNGASGRSSSSITWTSGTGVLEPLRRVPLCLRMRRRTCQCSIEGEPLEPRTGQLIGIPERLSAIATLVPRTLCTRPMLSIHRKRFVSPSARRRTTTHGDRALKPAGLDETGWRLLFEAPAARLPSGPSGSLRGLSAWTTASVRAAPCALPAESQAVPVWLPNGARAARALYRASGEPGHRCGDGRQGG